MPELKKTYLLPPLAIIRMVWASTIKFNENTNFDFYSSLIQPSLDRIISKSESNELEGKYVFNAITIMSTALKNINIIFKGRQLNYAENKELRKAYLEFLKDNLDIKEKFKKIINNLPGALIGGAGGLAFANVVITNFNFSEKFFVIILFTTLGFITNRILSEVLHYKKQINYIKQDFETTSYYIHYLNRVQECLHTLYNDLEKIHNEIFGSEYHTQEDGIKIIDTIIKESRPAWCKYTSKHIQENKITPEIWYICEIGDKSIEKCPFYLKEIKNNINYKK